MKDLRGKIAVVTGGGSGIGRGLALAFAESGMKVVVADVERDAAERVANEVGGLAVETDVSRIESVQALADRVFGELGAVHVLCNNAGVGVSGPIAAMTVEDWRWVLSVNVDGLVHGLVAFLPRMRAQPGEAHVVNTGSITGLLPLPGLGVYSATKSAIVAASEVLRAELAADGIGVTVVCPATVRTRILEADRNRPVALARSGAKKAESSQAMDRAIDPVDLGRRVREAVLENRPYVIAWNIPGLRAQVEARLRAIEAALPEDP